MAIRPSSAGPAGDAVKSRSDSGRTASFTGPGTAPRGGSVSSTPPTRTRSTPFRVVSSASTRFESPTKSATKRLTGASYSSRGVPLWAIAAWSITMMRSETASASCWSCVT